MLKFFSAAAILLVAIFLQLFFAGIGGGAGWYFNLALASLIAFASVFEFWELLVLDLTAVFILNWKPAPSVALLAFAFIPLAAFVFRKVVHAEPWIGNFIAIVVGFLAFYLIAAPVEFLPHVLGFFEYVVVGLAAGELIFFILA